ncbi:hypothetical protein ACWFRM_24855 [Streptomyces sp. NPDC055144]
MGDDAPTDEACVASVDPIEQTVYRDINDVTGDDINVYAAVAFKR